MNPVSIVIPVLNEGARIEAALAALAPCRARGVEVIVVDGGSSDDTCERARAKADRVLSAARGRASQMNAGAAVARGAVLIFLHADTHLPAEADRLAARALGEPGAVWGRFDIRIAGRHPVLPVVAALMNLRSRLTGIATGDQAMFVRRETFAQVGGFPDIALMEDIALSRTLRRIARPVCRHERVTTSGRRWEARGVWRTILLMWRLRLGYYFGAAPSDLARRYGYVPRQP